MNSIIKCVGLSAIAILSLSATAKADFIQPTAVIDHTPIHANNEFTFKPENAINGAGILGDFGQTAVIPSSLHKSQGQAANGSSGNHWMNAVTNDATTVYAVFDFEREAKSISGVYAWPWIGTGVEARSIKDVVLYVGDESVVPQITKAGWQSVLTQVGSISIAKATAGPFVGSQFFSLASPAENVRYVMFDVRSNHGGDSPTALYPGLAEIGFDGVMVPEPSTIALISLLLVGSSVFARIRRINRN